MGASTNTGHGGGQAAGAAYFDAEHETMPRERLAELQLQRLRATLRNAYDNVRGTPRTGSFVNAKPWL